MSSLIFWKLSTSSWVSGDMWKKLHLSKSLHSGWFDSNCPTLLGWNITRLLYLSICRIVLGKGSNSSLRGSCLSTSPPGLGFTSSRICFHPAAQLKKLIEKLYNVHGTYSFLLSTSEFLVPPVASSVGIADSTSERERWISTKRKVPSGVEIQGFQWKLRPQRGQRWSSGWIVFFYDSWECVVAVLWISEIQVITTGKWSKLTCISST